MVDTMRWNDNNNSLAAVADGSCIVWYYPEVVYVDRDLLQSTISKQPVRSPFRCCVPTRTDSSSDLMQALDWGKTAEIIEFRDTRVQASHGLFPLP